jgi:hypothetical protein
MQAQTDSRLISRMSLISVPHFACSRASLSREPYLYPSVMVVSID